MLRSFLTITFRILWRNRVTTFVNVFGLSVGMATFVFIMLYVHHEKSYDKFNKNYDRIYRLEADGYGKFPPFVGEFVKDRVPEVENIARFSGGWDADFYYEPAENPTAINHVEAKYFFADSTVFKVFTFPFVKGDARRALRTPMTAVLTESTAKKIFGKTDPMMKTVRFNSSDYTVTGVIKDIKDSHIQIDVLLSIESIPVILPDLKVGRLPAAHEWWSATYLLLAEGVDKIAFEKKLNKTLSEINDGKIVEINFSEFHVKEFGHLYFDGVLQNQPYGLHGNINSVRTLLTIGVFMLILAGINYINLTTARSTVRAKEIAVKRMNGSSVGQLRLQLIIESVIVSTIALMVAMTIIQLFLSSFNELIKTNLQYSDLNRPVVLAMIAAGGVLIGVIAGLYPAYYLTAINPAKLIKGEGIRGSGASFFRSGLMTFQFALSMIMIVAIIVNFRQLQFFRNADLGFNKNQTMIIVTPSDTKDDFLLRETFKERLLNHTGVVGVSNSFGNPGQDLGIGQVMEMHNIKIAPMMIYIDADYVDVMGLNIIDGRNFPKRAADMKRSPTAMEILVNETLVKEFGLRDPVGQGTVNLKDGVSVNIIGVVKDFHYASLHDKIKPMVIALIPVPGDRTSVRINTTDVQAMLKTIKSEWKTVFGGRSDKPFNYQFLDDTMDQQYKSDEQLSAVIGLFTVLAVVIACLGLFALSSFMVTRRTKEIGVRKVLGASLATIYLMLSWDFLKWILVAAVVACPIAWYLMQLWLESFAYHITVGPSVIVIAVTLSIAIALITITWQSLKAASANPVTSLRYE